MPGGQNFPEPPPLPQAPPPASHNLPMAGPPVAPQQQHHHAQHGVQHQAPLGNIIHQPGFQGQHAQGGGHFGQGQGQHAQGGGHFGQGQGNAQKQGGQNQQSQKMSFKYFQLRKPSSREVEIGVKPSWSMSKPTEVCVTSAEIEEKVRQLRLRSKVSVSDEYDALPSSVKEKVDQLLQQHRAMEKDQSMHWNIAAIGSEWRRIGFTGSVLIQVKVYIKKSLRTDMAGGKDKAPGGLQQGMGGMNQGGAPKQAQMPMQNMPMLNGHMGNQQGGFHGVPNGAHNMMPNMGPHMQHPNAAAHMQHPNVGPHMQHQNFAAHAQHQNAPRPFEGGSVPPNITVLDSKIGQNFHKHSKHGKHGKHGRKRRSRSRSKKDRRRRRERESDYDIYEDSDSSSRSSLTAAGDHSEEIEDLRDEVNDLKFDLRREQRKSRPFVQRRWSASASQLPRVPIGEYREPAHDAQRVHISRREPAHDAQRVHISRRERKIHYQSPDESDGLTDRSGPSIVESWMTGSSGFSRPVSDPPYTPPHSPGPRRSRDSFFREHTKPARVGYHTPPRSPHDRGSPVAYSMDPERRGSRLYLVEPDRRSSRVYFPDLVERKSSKVYLPLSDRRGSKVYLSDLSEKRSSKAFLPVLERRHTYEGDVGRKTSYAEDYIRDNERRSGRRDSWRRAEEDRYRGGDRYYGRSYHR